jgi:hypothetical protein
MTAHEIANRLVADAAALQREIELMERHFTLNHFFGDVGNLPYAHYGYLMAVLAQVDAVSTCHGESRVSQTIRMCTFLEAYVRSGKLDVHRTVVQMLRHSLMHTGALRYLYDTHAQAAYTWRVHFGDLPDGVTHYTITSVNLAHQEDILGIAHLAGVAPASIHALNISLVALSADWLQGVKKYVREMLTDPVLRARAETRYPKIQLQQKPLGAT